MAFTLSDLQRLRSGWLASHQIGQIPPDILSALGWDMPWVYLSTESCIHIFKKHPSLQEFELLALPTVIDHGLLVRERHRPNCVVAICEHAGKRYIAAMKRPPSHEIWVTTFHRARPRQTRGHF